ncbi:MAG: RimK family protein [Thiotrichales bacterium]
MPELIVLVEDLEDWRPEYPQLQVITADAYLASDERPKDRRMTVINLCHNQKYQGLGYYCSLLAEARGQRVIPSVRTALDLTRPPLFNPRDGFTSGERRYLNALTVRRIKFDILFGQTTEPALAGLAREIFDTFRAPLLRVEMRRNGHWGIHSVRAFAFDRLRKDQHQLFADALNQYLTRRWREPEKEESYRYDVAILHDPNDSMPPSNARALSKFIQAGRKIGLDVELITPKHFGRLLEFDALFIRATTQVNHYTYRFARRAEREGMVVIDDPLSILRCSNKVYLAELLQRHRVPIPTTVILTPRNLDVAEARCRYPMVLKTPDGSFSRGVAKVNSRAELEKVAGEWFKVSELILAQQFTPTEFDWRVGVLNQEALFACRYYMAKKHWQIVKHGPRGGADEGDSDTVPIAAVPPKVIEIALKAAKLMGNGLYGVDLKETPNGIKVIEVNDNPNLEAGIEDEVLKDALYDKVMAELLRRLEARGKSANNQG